MIAHKDFASLIPFKDTADGNGEVFVEDTSTTGDNGRNPREVDSIYIKTEQFFKKERTRHLNIELRLLTSNDNSPIKTLEDFLEITRLGKPEINKKSSDRMAAKADGAVDTTTAEGEFIDCHVCVPGIDFNCEDKPQLGIVPKSNLVGAYFGIRAILSGYRPGDVVSGYIILGLKS